MMGETNLVSFTRNKLYVFNKQDADILIRLVVDGDKLSNRHRIVPYNSMGHYVSYFKRVYGVDINSLDEDELLELGVDQGDDIKDLPHEREQEESVRGPIKNISKYIREIQIDASSINPLSINILKKNLQLMKDVVYFRFIKESNKDKKLNGFMLNRLSNGDSINKFVEILSDFYETTQSELASTDNATRFIRLCKENDWKVRNTSNEVIAFAPARDLGWNSSDNINIFYNKAKDRISIFDLSETYDLSKMNSKQFRDSMIELATS